MFKYYVNLSRLDMSIIIYALETLKLNSIIDIDNKQDRALVVLIEFLKDMQDGQDPKTNFTLRTDPRACAKAFDILLKKANS